VTPTSQASEELAARSSECEAQARQLKQLRGRLDAEASMHRSSRQRVALLETKLHEVIGAASDVASASARAVTVSAEREAEALVDATDTLLREEPSPLASSGDGGRQLHLVSRKAAFVHGSATGATKPPPPIRPPEESPGAGASPAPWRDPFGEDYNSVSSSGDVGSMRAIDKSGHRNSGAGEEEGGWWFPFSRRAPPQVGGGLVLRV
jgi:hypothetical protein